MTDVPDDVRHTVDDFLDSALENNEDVSTEQMMARAITLRAIDPFAGLMLRAVLEEQQPSQKGKD